MHEQITSRRFWNKKSFQNNFLTQRSILSGKNPDARRLETRTDNTGLYKARWIYKTTWKQNNAIAVLLLIVPFSKLAMANHGQPCLIILKLDAELSVFDDSEARIVIVLRPLFSRRTTNWKSFVNDELCCLHDFIYFLWFHWFSQLAKVIWTIQGLYYILKDFLLEEYLDLST